ncbi:MAG: ABC transporter substrate-binding protein [Cellulosilyticaceae bacterium]
MKKKLSLILTMLLGVSLIGCSAKVEESPIEKVPTQEESVAGQTLTVGVMGSVDTIPLVIAEQKGFFDANGVDVNIEVFKAAKDRDAALQAGELDGVLCDEVAISIYKNAGIDMKITGITDGQFGLVAGADTGIASVADLVGKKVAISENTVIEYTLDKMLEANGIAISDVEKVAIPPMPTRLEMLNNGEVDAAIMPNPFSDAAIKAGGTMIEKVDNTGVYISVTGFLQEAIDTKAAEIKAYYNAYDQAVDYLNTTDISEYEDIIISTVGYPEEMKGNIALPTYRKNVLPPVEEIEEVLTWSKDKGILTREITAQDVISEVGLQ